MGYGQRLRVQRTADVRVLKSQLDLIANVAHSARFIAPAWALAIAYFGSSAFAYMGSRPIKYTLILPLLVSIVSFAASKMTNIYRDDTASHANALKLQAWFTRYIVVQVALSAAWGLMPWLLWTDGDFLNHVFIAAVITGVISWVVVSRASHMEMFLAGMIPVVALTSLRFIFGGYWMDMGIAFLMPLYAWQLYYDGRRLTFRLDEDSRLRFEVKTLPAKSRKRVTKPCASVSRPRLRMLPRPRSSPI